jgi:hypothetical protein
MFTISMQQYSVFLEADGPEDAVKKHRKAHPKEETNNVYYDVWDVDRSEFFVICHNIDAGPENPHLPKYEKIVHFTKEERTKLVESMMHEAHCSDANLRQLCEMAATQINDQSSYDDWVNREEDDEADS